MAARDATRWKLLAKAKAKEDAASGTSDEALQARLLDDTVWHKIIANLPSYRSGIR